MKKKNSNAGFLFAITFSLLLYGCGQSGSVPTPQNDEIPAEKVVMKIDTFSTFPPEIEGCSCYFAVDSADFENGHYIYMNNYDKTSFLKINGVLTKFTETERKEQDSTTRTVKFKAPDYELSIQIKDGPRNGDETWLKTGTIQLSHKSGKILIKPFYGECGC